MTGKLNLLIAEDDVVDRQYLEHLLGGAGPVSVFHVSTGDAVVSYLAGTGEFRNRQVHPYPDILLLDLGLPRVDGLGVLEWMAATPSLAPLSVYVLTGSENPEALRQATRYGVAGYFLKPLTLAQVAWIFEDHLAIGP